MKNLMKKCGFRHCLVATYVFAVYTLYALCEYYVVASNMAFHGTGVFEFGHAQYVCTLPYEEHQTRRGKQDKKES